MLKELHHSVTIRYANTTRALVRKENDPNGVGLASFEGTFGSSNC